MGDACGLGRSRVVSRFCYFHQAHRPNGHAGATVGEPREQVFDRDLLHLVYRSCVECEVYPLIFVLTHRMSPTRDLTRRCKADNPRNAAAKIACFASHDARRDACHDAALRKWKLQHQRQLFCLRIP
jgi:hypothetical protein